MRKLRLLFISALALNIIVKVKTSDVFHVNSKITFHPDEVSEYFGYSVLLSDMGFYVGAPKAKSRHTKNSAPGAVFTCPFDNLDISNVTCHPLNLGRRYNIFGKFIEHDMWFGATLAETFDNKLWVCAPRLTRHYQFDKKPHQLANGACYVLDITKNRIAQPYYPLQNGSQQSYVPDGSRKEYEEYGTLLNYYAYGQSGFSLACTKDNNIVIGAPGILQNAGAVINYKLISIKNTWSTWSTNSLTNPYYTKDLGPDDYFGYSVGSGVFEVNGTVLYVAGAPRSEEGYGQVIIFKPIDRNDDQLKPLNVKAKLRGPQLGGYFGAVLCTLDLDGDGVSDLLVGAPNFARSDGKLTYDQGAVFVYITRRWETGFILKDTGSVQGSGESGSRFGSAIADLGDIDGDGYADVAIGAPWENEGRGVVYIYRGSKLGLSTHHYQRIYADGAMGFGLSISKGFDVDKNNCSDLAVGAYNSGTAFIYRSIPTIHVVSTIKIPDEGLSQEVTNFTALFCITVPPNERWKDVELQLRATVTADAEGNRTFLQRDRDLIFIAKPGLDKCENVIIEVNNQSDLSRPIELKFSLKPVSNIDEMSTFPAKKARLSETSVLDSSLLVQLVKDCGEDLICTPWLEMSLEFYVIEMAYVPGTKLIPAINIRVKNLEEPAYSVKLHVVLPCPPIRMDERCSLQNLNLTCDMPSPLNRNETAGYDFRLGYVWDGSATEIKIVADFKDTLNKRNVSDGAKELIIPIVPISEYSCKGKSNTKATLIVARETMSRNGAVLFKHSYEITNMGPSDLYNMTIDFLLPEGIILLGNVSIEDNILRIPTLMLKAHATTVYHLSMRLNLTYYGKLLEHDNIRNVTTAMNYFMPHGSRGTAENGTIEVTTTLSLEPSTSIWRLLIGPVAGLVAGLLVLAAIIMALCKFGFFSRQKKEELKKLLEDQAPPAKAGTSSSSDPPSDDSTTQELHTFSS